MPADAVPPRQETRKACPFVTSPEAPVSRGEAAQAISNALVRLLRDYTGRGPTQAYTTITDSHVIVVLRDALLKAERSLVKDGHADAVIDMRRRFQRTMKGDLVAAIEANTGREVLAFLSDHHIDPDIAVEIFILKPRAGDGDGATASRDANGANAATAD